jgi:Putative porin
VFGVNFVDMKEGRTVTQRLSAVNSVYQRKFCLPLLFSAMLCITAFSAHSQQFPGVPGRAGGGFGGNTGGFGNQQQQQQKTGNRTGRQGIDDSTKVIYGPRTVRFFYEADLFNNRKTLFTTDTLLVGVHQYNFVQRNQNLYQDLGNLGTALRPVFYQTPTQIGATTGYSAYSPYTYQTDQVKYIDTKSPFTRMYFVLGGRNQNVLNFDFSQNVNPRFNLGFNAQRVTTKKVFGTSGQNDQNRFLMQQWAFLAHANYHSKDEKYDLLVHFNHLNIESNDQGGVLPNALADGTVDKYSYEGRAILPVALSAERRNLWHIYHQYKLAPGFQIYQRVDYHRQINSFTDANLAGDSRLNYQYPMLPTALRPARFDSTKTQQDVFYRLLENSAGLKGIFKTGRSAFNYRAYIRQRIYGQTGQYNQTVIKTDSSTTVTYANKGQRNGFEQHLGLWLGYYFPDSLTRLTAEGEYLVGGGLRLEGQLESKLFTVGYRSVFADPTLLQQQFISNQYRWINSFGLRGTQHAYGTLNVRYKNARLSPGLDYQLLTNYVYADTAAVIRQASGAFSVLRIGLGWQFAKGRFGISGQGYSTVTSRDDIMRVPALFLNTRITYDFIFSKVLFVQTGVELHYKSSYKADAFDPLTQQFYLQNRQSVEGYVVADLFANFRINRTRLFVKLAHANQGLGVPGYYVAPDFLAMRRSFAFGVDWYLFD